MKAKTFRWGNEGVSAQFGGGQRECGRHGVVHVSVGVLPEASAEHDARFALGQCPILGVACRVGRVVDGVIGFAVRAGGYGVFASHDGEGQVVVAPGLEVLVLDAARIGNVGRGVVDHGVALVVGRFEEAVLEAQAAVIEPPQAVVEVFVDAAREDHASRQRTQRAALAAVVHAGAHLNAFEQGVDERVVAAGGDALIRVVEIIIVEAETQRDAAYDESRELRGRTAPLLFGIAADEALVDVASAKFQRLFLEIARLADMGIGGPFALDVLPCFSGGADAPKLVERIHVERQVVELVAVTGYRTVDEGNELDEPVHVGPDFAVIGVEDVGAVAVDGNALAQVAVYVAARVGPAVDDKAPAACFAGLVGKDGTEKAGADNQVVVGGINGVHGRMFVSGDTGGYFGGQILSIPRVNFLQ